MFIKYIEIAIYYIPVLLNLFRLKPLQFFCCKKLKDHNRMFLILCILIWILRVYFINPICMPNSANIA